jgi:molybdate transport system substrate-binding protein
MYTAAVTARAAHPTEAAALIALLTGADRKELRRSMGFTG